MSVMGFPYLMFYAAPVCLFAMWMEYQHSMEINFKAYTRKDFFNNISLGILGIVTGIVTSAYVLSLYYWSYTGLASLRQELLGYDYLGWAWWAWILAFVADDFTYYWFHRSAHTVRVMWASHVIHHSSDHFNFSTAVRLSALASLYKPFLWIWMTALGVHPLMVLTCVAVETLYQFFIHTRYWPWWDRFSGYINTPGLHAIHHGKEDFCIDKNFGGFTILFDRLFGTYQPVQPKREVQYGVTQPPTSQNIWEITSHEFKSLIRDIRNCRTIFEALQYTFRKPGWKPKQRKAGHSIVRHGIVYARRINQNAKSLMRGS